jgi:LysR family hydrogen peroxide-inducible transcriptional activator
MTSEAQLQYLLAVDLHRHFGRAAKSCHVTQPTLSAGLAKLEDELGVILFDRSVQPIVPTASGESLIEQARVILGEMARFKNMAQHTSKEISGSLSVGVIPTVSPYLLPLFLDEFAVNYPKLNLEIREMTTDDIVESLNKEAIDVGILAIPVEGASLQAVSLYKEPFYFYVHLDHVLAKKRTIESHDIDGAGLWLLEEGHCFRGQVLDACGLRGDTPVLANLRFESGSLETLKRLVAKGVGYTLIPHLALSENEEDVKVIRFSKPIPAREIGLMFKRTQLKRPAIDAMTALIQKKLPSSLVKAGKDVETISVV